ncbi:M48 family metallopeptidase [Brachyspira innocens]|uniref:tetratricopeptide repeat protein n=1 Tax=Brachyspira innocens TaxID=13264 RepID=UPI0026EA3796|nr:tetratricopeptide repeat protein [Brachyspira innocens]
MNLTNQEQNYYELILDMLDDGIIDDSERRLLNKKKDRYGLSDARAKEIEYFALQEIQNKNKPKFNTEGEEEYYELLEDMLEDGAIDENGKNLLNKRKSKYGISDEKAKEFEDYIKSVKVINNNTVSNSSSQENSDDLFQQGMLYYDDEILELIEKLENADEGKELKLVCNEALDKIKQLFQNENYNYTEAFFNLSAKLVAKLYYIKRYSDILYINKNISILEANGYSDFINDALYLYCSSMAYYYIDSYYKAIDGFINLIENYNLNDELLCDVMFSLSYSYLALGNYQDAIEGYEKTLDLDYSNPYAWQNYGIALENAGRIEDAKYAYNKSLEIYPDNDYVKERLRNISSPSDIVSGIVKGIGKFFK